VFMRAVLWTFSCAILSPIHAPHALFFKSILIFFYLRISIPVELV
jgi:hypothetical protein